jgi:hypothetical protein
MLIQKCIQQVFNNVYFVAQNMFISQRMQVFISPNMISTIFLNLLL